MPKGRVLPDGTIKPKMPETVLKAVKPDLANVGEKLKVDILGKMYEATILDESPYDTENKLLRA